MAHEARNVLNAVAINVEVLGDRIAGADPVLFASVSKYVSAIKDQVRRVDGVIRSYVELASPPRREDAVDVNGWVARPMRDDETAGRVKERA
jgi:hypothetical protein